MPKPMNRPIPAHTAKRYAEAYTVDEQGCWVSTYAETSTGYAFAAWRADSRAYGTTAHRAAWTHHNGQIPDDMTIHHECFNRMCVNPDHLALLSNADNARRQGGHDFPLGECEFGHPDSMRKLYGQKKPVWRCGECVRIRNAMLTERAKQARADARALRDAA